MITSQSPLFSPITPTSQNVPKKKNQHNTKMSNIYCVIITCLHTQSQSLPEPPAEVSDYEVWAHGFLQLLVSCPRIHLQRLPIHLQMVFDGISKGMKDPVMEQMVDKATKVLEAIADKSWAPWAEWLIPNISCQFRVEAEAKAQAEQDHKL